MVFPLTFAQEVVVKAGDTLWSLAERYNTTVEAILEVNGLTGRDLLPGAVLKLPSAETYTVQAGDTLYDIAVAFNLSVDDLIALNGLEGSRILVGQTLRLRASASTPAPAPLVVTVKPGDSLWGIARAYEVSLEALSSANHLTKEAVLHPGDTLVIPGRYADASDADQGGAAAPTITVAKGESLWLIAGRYNTTVSALMSVNNLRSSKLFVGQKLRIVPAAELLPATPSTPAPQLGPSMVWPLVGVITSRFGYRQLHGSTNHTGLDIDGETGDPILAATAGVVIYSGWRSGYGNLIIVEADKVQYYYAHASELLVRAGELVQAGQVIALVGSTGFSTGSHLHFEIRVDGAPVDPLPILERQAARP